MEAGTSTAYSARISRSILSEYPFDPSSAGIVEDDDRSSSYFREISGQAIFTGKLFVMTTDIKIVLAGHTRSSQ